mgnify:FL=1
MKQKYIDMLKGAAISQAMSSSESSDSKTFLNKDSHSGHYLMVIWVAIVSLYIMVVIIVLMHELVMNGPINILGLSFDDARLIIVAIVLGGLGWYIYYKIFNIRLVFWVTFLPFFIYFLIWFFVPSANVISYMPNMFWFV